MSVLHKSTLLAALLWAIVSLAAYAMPSAPAETGFLESGDTTYLSYDNTEYDFDHDGQSYALVRTKDGVLHLLSGDGQYQYGTFSGYYGSSGAVDYAVRPIYTIFPSMTFYEIIATEGAHARNCGYWLIGQSNGQWVAYVTIDTLASAGYTAQEWHRISTASNKDATGRFILTSSHQYMPPGAIYGYQAKNVVDLRLQFHWDQENQCITISRM